MRNPVGPASAAWKGDAAGKSAFHRRLYALHGKPRQCAVCSTTNVSKSYDYANLTGNYADITDYKPMCRSCHSKYDSKVHNIAGMRTAPNERTHCKRGHELTGDNVFVRAGRANGQSCRACARLRDAKHKQFKRFGGIASASF